MSVQSQLSPFAALAPMPFERVLVGVSLAPGDEPALAAATRICHATSARLCVVHAVEDAGQEWSAPEAPELGGLQHRVEEAVRALPGGPQLDHEVRVRVGAAHRVLDEEAQRFAPDLVVVGATAGERRSLLGSTAERVVRRSAAPVLVVRGALDLPPRQVVAPVDLSDLSACGFHCGLGVVDRFGAGRGVRVLALFAIGYLDPLAHEMRRTGLTQDEMLARARARLDTFVAEHRPEGGLEVEARVVLGPAREEILGAAEREGADLLVLATHGHGGFERLLMGSVASTIVREATCSVLLVPPIAAYGNAVGEAVLSQTAPGRRDLA